MTAGLPEPNEPRRPADVEREAAAWVVRRQAGLSPHEALAFECWCDESPLHRDAVVRLDAVSAAMARARATGAMENIRAGLAARRQRRHLRHRVMAAAAVLVVGAGLALSIRNRPVVPATAPTLRTVARIEHLPDGSTVELKRGAAIAVHFTPAFRFIDLERGEAFFRVAHDKVHPFIVRAGGVNVRAVGTQFAVALDPANVEVLVTEGRVGLSNTAHGESLLPRGANGEREPLRPGQRAVISRRAPDSAAIARIDGHAMARQLAWRNPHLELDSVPLATAIRQLNAENSVQIMLAEPAIGQLRLSGSFPAHDPRTFARLAADTFGLTYEEPTPGRIVLRNP